MKTIKILVQLNFWLIGIMVLLYLSFWGGILMQILLGMVQIAFFIYLLRYYSTFKMFVKTHLVIYGSLTAILLSILFISSGELMMVVWIGSLPLVGYFTYILYQTKKQLS